MAKRLEGKPFHIIAAHNQHGTKENVVAYLKSQGLAEDTPNVTVTSFGRHPMVKGTGYVPYYMVFDQHGELAHHHMCGPYHGGDGFKMVEWVDNLLKDVSAIYLGKEPYRAVPKLAAAVGKKKNLPATILAIRKKLDAGATGAEKAELERLVAAIGDYRTRMLERADKLVGINPSAVIPSLTALLKDFRGTPAAADVDAKLRAQKANKDLKTAIALDKSFRKSMKRLGKMKEPSAKARRKTAEKLTKLIAGHEGLPITAKIQQAIDELK